MLLTSLLGAFSRSYTAGAVTGWGKTGAKGGIAIGNFNLLKELGTSDQKAVVSLPDLKALEKQLKEFGPDSLKKFKNNARQLGTPARNAIRSVFRTVGIHGPLGAPRRPGRKYDKMSTNYSRGHLSYSRSVVLSNNNRGVDLNYKNRNESKALRQLATAQDGTISIVRVIVKAPAFIVADMAGKSNKGKKAVGSLSRQYETDLFGRGIVTKKHVITPARRAAIDDWLEALNRRAHNRRQGTASRYAWPTMTKYMPTHKSNAARLLNEVIAVTNKKLAE